MLHKLAALKVIEELKAEETYAASLIPMDQDIINPPIQEFKAEETCGASLRELVEMKMNATRLIEQKITDLALKHGILLLLQYLPITLV